MEILKTEINSAFGDLGAWNSRRVNIKDKCIFLAVFEFQCSNESDIVLQFFPIEKT